MPPAKTGTPNPARKVNAAAGIAPGAPRRRAASLERPAENFTSAANLFRALSHPLRVQLVCGLLHEPVSQTSIARTLGLSQSLIAQHLAVLRRSGIVRGTRHGGEVVLEVTDQRLPAVFSAICPDPRKFLSLGWQAIAQQRERKAAP